MTYSHVICLDIITDPASSSESTCCTTQAKRAADVCCCFNAHKLGPHYTYPPFRPTEPTKEWSRGYLRRPCPNLPPERTDRGTIPTWRKRSVCVVARVVVRVKEIALFHSRYLAAGRLLAFARVGHAHNPNKTLALTAAMGVCCWLCQNKTSKHSNSGVKHATGTVCSSMVRNDKNHQKLTFYAQEFRDWFFNLKQK